MCGVTAREVCRSRRSPYLAAAIAVAVRPSRRPLYTKSSTNVLSQRLSLILSVLVTAVFVVVAAAAVAVDHITVASLTVARVACCYNLSFPSDVDLS